MTTKNDSPVTGPVDDPDHAAHRLSDLMKDFRVAMLVTHDSGELRARPMYVAAVEPENPFVFASSLKTAKIEEIRKHPKVLVTMQSASQYVSIGGPCVISQDRAEMEHLWNESWRPDTHGVL
jgi:general stress protein 26